MASNLTSRPLAVASQRVIDALLALDAAVELSVQQRAHAASQAESVQANVTASWAAHSSALEAQLQSLQSEQVHLQQENQSLSNELQALRQQYIALQHTAGKVAKRLDQSIEQLDMLLESA